MDLPLDDLTKTKGKKGKKGDPQQVGVAYGKGMEPYGKGKNYNPAAGGKYGPPEQAGYGPAPGGKYGAFSSPYGGKDYGEKGWGKGKESFVDPNLPAWLQNRG